MPETDNDAAVRQLAPADATGPGRAALRALRLAMPLALVLLAGGCSAVPDALNPVEWYQGAAEALSGEDTASAEEAPPAAGTLAAERGQPAPGSDAPFPNLASVPERPEVDSAETRRQIAEGLVADRQQARYSSEVIRRQGDDVAPPPPPVIPTTAPEQAKPAVAQPAEPVAAVEPAESGPAAPVLPAAVPEPPPVAAVQPEPPPPVPAPIPEPQPQRIAAMTPPPVPAAPALGSDVREVFRSRLAEQNRLPSQMTADAGPGGVGGPATADYSTVVVSSGGVVAAGDLTGSADPSAVMPMAARTPVRAAPMAPLPAFGTVKVATIIFANGSSRLSSRDRKILGDVIALHRQRGGTVHVVGHASSRTRAMDPQRHQAVNYKMSAARAEAVAAALASMGVPQDAIRIDARSDGDPVYYEVMPTGEAGNRRAEIYLES